MLDLHHNPRIYVIPDFMTAFECSSMISYAKAQQMQRAKVVGAKESFITDARTNDLCWIDHHSAPVFSRIAKKVANLLGMPLLHAESFQLIHYKPDAEYKAHFDAFDPRTEEGHKNWCHGGQRLVTVLGYLNTVDAGGSTNFPKLGISVKAEAGKLLVFHNCEAGTLKRHPDTLHAGMPVISGEKWAFNLWFRAHSRYDPSPPTKEEMAEFTDGP